jgi:cell division protein FtsW (lipid II flippase)
MESAPYISGIFGFVIFFLIARYWKKKGYANAFKLSFLFPLVYLIMDIVIVLVAQVDWSTYALIFIIANGAKFLGSYLGYKLSKQAHVVTGHEA